MSDAGTFVYVLEEDMVSAILAGWPAQMQVAVCLTSGGGCDLAVHHCDEIARVLDRVSALNGTSRQDLCVAPQFGGYPTRKVLFSEEQQLLSLVADSPQLAEIASDYAINYRFAQDEGLDADMVTGANARRRSQQFNGSAHVDQYEQGESASEGMSARSQAFLDQLSLPLGYAAPSPEQRAECVFVQARLQRAGDTIRLIIAPDQATGLEPAVMVTRIGCRDDFASFVLPRAVLKAWTPGRVAVLDMPADLFPEAVVDRYMREPHHCEVTVTLRGVFVSPGAPVSATPLAPAAAKAGPQTSAKRRSFKSVHAASVALVAVLLITGHFATALERASSSQTAVYTSGNSTDAALDIITAMARADTVN